MSSTIVSTTPIATPSAEQLKAIQALERQLAALKLSFGLPADAAPARRTKGSKKAAKTAAGDSSVEAPKRTLKPEIAAMNTDRIKIFAELRDAWLAQYPQFTEAARAAWAEDASAKTKKVLADAVKAASVPAPPRFSDALVEHGKRLRASDPTGEVAKKQDARRKKLEAEQAERRSVKSGGSDTSSVSAPAPAPAPEPAKKRGGGRKKKDATAPAPAPAPAPEPVKTSIVVVSDDNEEAFKDWTHSGVQYFKNGLNYVYRKTSKGGFGDYAGQYNPATRHIDATVPEPEPEDE